MAVRSRSDRWDDIDLLDDLSWYDETFEDGLDEADADDLDDDWDDDDLFEPSWIDAIGDALNERYDDALPEELELAVEHMLDSLSESEAIPFDKALRSAGAGLGRAVGDPAVTRVATQLAPVAGGAVGGAVGGAAGARLGASAAKALAAGGAKKAARSPQEARPGQVTIPGRVGAEPAGARSPGSAAAAQGLLLTQCPDVLRCLLAASLGEHGKRQIDGIPVAGVMKMLSTVFAEAAADAEALSDRDGDRSADIERWSSEAEVPFGDRSHVLYRRLLASTNGDLA